MYKMRGGGRQYHGFLSKTFVPWRRKISLGKHLVCHSFWVSKNFLLERILSRFFVEVFSSDGAERLHCGNLGCFTKNLVSKKIWIKSGETRECQDFWSKNICLTVQKKL